ncbi:MAG: murein L,D-transpeptidase [Chryseobacterium sp.]|nr:MAG: murein L,D-transpeptidase [Chryseobacterium sp.]
MHKSMIAGIAFAVTLSLTQCKDTDSKIAADNGLTKTESTNPKVPEIKRLDVNYRGLPMKGNDSVQRAFRKDFTGEKFRTVLALNRIDENNFYTADTLVVPDKFAGDLLAYSPFPYTVSSLKDVDKIALFSYPVQAFAVYESGKLKRWGPTSMGSKQHPTPTGLFFTNWKGEEVISTFDDEWLLKWNFNIENDEGIGWHQYNMPGYPASHSCLRLFESDAKWMYDWADQWKLKDKGQTVEAKGTPVIVYGSYDFDGRRPWLNLLKDPKANDISEQQLNGIIEPYLSKIKQEQQNSEQHRNSGNRT